MKFQWASIPDTVGTLINVVRLYVINVVKKIDLLKGFEWKQT